MVSIHVMIIVIKEYNFHIFYKPDDNLNGSECQTLLQKWTLHFFIINYLLDCIHYYIINIEQICTYWLPNWEWLCTQTENKSTCSLHSTVITPFCKSSKGSVIICSAPWLTDLLTNIHNIHTNILIHYFNPVNSAW